LGLKHTWRLTEDEEHRWLIAGLWSEQAVGIVGGKPECCKSFLALDAPRRSPPCPAFAASPYAAENARAHIADGAALT
jgi:hypothetical protein